MTDTYTITDPAEIIGASHIDATGPIAMLVLCDGRRVPVGVRLYSGCDNPIRSGHCPECEPHLFQALHYSGLRLDALIAWNAVAMREICAALDAGRDVERLDDDADRLSDALDDARRAYREALTRFGFDPDTLLRRLAA